MDLLFTCIGIVPEVPISIAGVRSSESQLFALLLSSFIRPKTASE